MANYLLIVCISVTLLQDSSNTPVAFKSIKKVRATIPYQLVTAKVGNGKNKETAIANGNSRFLVLTILLKSQPQKCDIELHASIEIQV